MHVALVAAELEENLAIRYLWGSLKAAGHRVTLVVFNHADDTERAARELADTGAPLAGMSMVFTRRAAEFVALAARARELGFAGHVTVGGHFAAFNAEDLLRDSPSLSSVVVGEGEGPICALAASLDDLSAVAGLVWRDGDRVVRNAPADKPRDLDALPWPVRRRPYDRYLGLPIVNVLGSRGCSHHCHFCSITAWHRMCGGARLRLRAPEKVAEEMAALYAEGVRVFNFHDDNFLLGSPKATHRRLDRLEAGLRERGVDRFAFAIKARPDEVDRELFARLKRMGLFRVFLGVEAGTAESLLQLGRGQLLTDNERALGIVNDLDIHAAFNLLMWNPESTLDDVALNVEFLRRHPHNPMNFCRTEIYSGTPLLQMLKDQDRLLGTYWGHDYRMTDEGAERSFEIAYSAFAERNYGDTSLHHWTMRLDFERQLLAHFGGGDDRLRRRVKDFVVEVNVDTSEHLAEIVRGVREGRGRDPRFVQGIVRSVAGRDAELDAVARQILASLAQAGEHARGGGAWVRRAAAAGLAATLAFGTGCPADDEDGTHYSETVPVPVEPVRPQEPTHVAEMAPTPPEPPAPPEGAAADIRPAFDRLALQDLAEAVRPPRDVVVELTLGPDGAVTEVHVTGEGLDDATRERAEAAMRDQRFEGESVVGHHFRLEVTARELRRALRPPPTHPTEMAPRPTHSREMAPTAPRPPEKIAPHPSEMIPKPPGSRDPKDGQ